MENASAAFLDAGRRSMRAIRQALGSTAVNPALLSCAERLQYDGYLRREEAHGTVRALAGTGMPIKEIVRRTGRSRKLVRGIHSRILPPHELRARASLLRNSRPVERTRSQRDGKYIQAQGRTLHSHRSCSVIQSVGFRA